MKNKGFTMLELIVSIFVVALLASLIFVGYNSVSLKVKDNRRLKDIDDIRSALSLYKKDFGYYPTSLTPGQPLAGPDGKNYLNKVPNNIPSGDCHDNYLYSVSANGSSYKLNYCLSIKNDSIEAGSCSATPSSICCKPQCSGKVCGNDGCGGACGTCSGAKNICNNGQCVSFKPCPGFETLYYRGITYNTTWIDINNDANVNSGECWFRENLATTKKPDDSSLIKDTNYRCVGNLSSLEDCASVPADNLGNNTGSTSILGFLYNWSTAMNLDDYCNSSDCSSLITFPHQGICPTGWHIPSDSEWASLINYAEDVALNTTNSICANMSDCNNAGRVLKQDGVSDTSWKTLSLPNPDNQLGLYVRGSGHYISSWSERGTNTFFWSANQSSQNNALIRDFYGGFDNKITWNALNKDAFVSIRCIKD